MHAPVIGSDAERAVGVQALHHPFEIVLAHTDARARSDRAVELPPSHRCRRAVVPKIVVAVFETQPARRRARRRDRNVRPVASASDVARSVSSGGSAVSLTLSPMPTTTWPTRSPSLAISVRMPAIFLGGSGWGVPRGPQRVTSCTSLGHFSCGFTPNGAIAAATAAPASRVSGGTSTGGRCGRSSTENVRFAPGVACQLRPSRPRPPVCSSVITTSPSAAPARPRAAATSLVEPHDARHSHGRPSQRVDSARATRALSSGSKASSSTSAQLRSPLLHADVEEGDRGERPEHRETSHLLSGRWRALPPAAPRTRSRRRAPSG